jgi:hypothetical protein
MDGNGKAIFPDGTPVAPANAMRSDNSENLPLPEITRFPGLIQGSDYVL